MSLLAKSQGAGGYVVDLTDGNEPELLYGRGGQPSVAVSGEIFFFGERDEDLLGLSKADEDLVLLPEQLFGTSGIYSWACLCLNPDLPVPAAQGSFPSQPWLFPSAPFQREN